MSAQPDTMRRRPADSSASEIIQQGVREWFEQTARDSREVVVIDNAGRSYIDGHFDLARLGEFIVLILTQPERPRCFCEEFAARHATDAVKSPPKPQPTPSGPRLHRAATEY